MTPIVSSLCCKNPKIRTLNFEGQAAVGSYLMINKLSYQAVRFFNRLLGSLIGSYV